MNTTRSWVACLCALLMLAPAVPAQQQPAPSSPSRSRVGLFSDFSRRYRATDLPPINLRNSGRLEALLRAGRLYLTVQDTIALALENNLDIELQRYGPQQAQANLLRAEAGGLLRGIQQTVQQGPNSAANLATGGVGASGGLGGGGNAGNGSGGTGGTIITATGVAIPSLDEGLFFNYNVGRRNIINQNPGPTGAATIRTDSSIYDFGFQKGFLTGTTVVAGYSNVGNNTNAPNAVLNPVLSSNWNVQVTQRLLQGYGLAVNNRNIRIARNNLRANDLTFQRQIIATVSSIVNLYYDLVSFNEDVKVRRQALAYAEKLYNDNKKQVEIGTLAPIEIVRAEAEVARTQQELVEAETRVLQQETVLKNAISRTGVASPSVADARIVPVDALQVPGVEPVRPVQDLVSQALENRPELAQTRVNLENARIGLLGSRSQLLPSLDVVLNTQSNALAGTVNPSSPLVIGGLRPPSELTGGFGRVLSQLFAVNYPAYSIGFQLNVPIRNRQAQADLILDQVSVRQAEVRQQQEVNQIRVDVQNSVIGIQQARARYAAAVKSRQLQEQTLDAEQKKYALGASTIFFVIQAQRDLALAQGAEVSALSNYSRAKTTLAVSTGQLLTDFSVEIAEAARGEVVRPASNLPALDPK